jgi:hypothetical protein
MIYTWLTLAIVSTVGYHLVLKITPAAAHPFLSLAVTYALGSAIFVGAYAVTPGAASLRASVNALSWTPLRSRASSYCSTSAISCSIAPVTT